MNSCPDCQQPVEDGARFCGGCGAACAAPAAAPPDPFVGLTVNGKFKVEALIGQGGMGKVYRARHLTLDRPVVLKMLHRTYSDDPQVSQRFQREARAASRLNHPHSIAVLDFGAAEDGTLFMAMEYLPGRDLARVISDDRPLPEERIVRIGAQILSALAEAHAQGIIHRDLKPENVMVEPRRDEPDFVKVLDFGIAKITAGADEPKLTAVGLVCGTPEYMSPEQARGGDLDARSDLYSVGVILYQMATGDLPFHSDTPVGFLTKHLAEVPVAPQRRRPDLSAPLDALIRRTLEKDPARRYPDAGAMREALLACAGAAPGAPARSAPVGSTLSIDLTDLEAIDEPAPAAPAAAARPAPPAAAARPATPPPPAAPAATAAPAPRSPMPLIAGGLVLAGLVAAGVYFLAGREGPKAAPPVPAPAQPVAAPVTPPAQPQPPEPVPPAPTPAPTTAAAEPAPSAAAPPPPAVKAPAPAPARDRQARAAPVTKVRADDLVRRGDALRAGGDVGGAIRAYLAAEGAEGALPVIQKKLAVCYQQQGDTRAARERYRRYLATDPPDAEKVRMILDTLQ